jgi:hypothetical protein
VDQNDLNIDVIVYLIEILISFWNIYIKHRTYKEHHDQQESDFDQVHYYIE